MAKAVAMEAQLVAPSSHWGQKNLVVVMRMMMIKMMMISKMTLMMRGRWRTTGDVFCL